MKASRGAKCLYNGQLLENKVRSRLASLLYDGFPIQLGRRKGAAENGPDISLVVGMRHTAMEVKKRAFECGGRTFKMRQGNLILPLDKKYDLFRSLLPRNFSPYNGRIPKCFFTKCAKDWGLEKNSFKGCYIPVNDCYAIANYYAQQGSDYIYIENYGLYHTGYDILGLGVPLIKCKCRFRIRCKQYRTSSLPSSVQIAFTIIKKTLMKSPYDLFDDARLPYNFTVAA